MVDEARHQGPLQPRHHDRGGHRFHGKFDVGAIKNSFNLGVELSREVNDNASYVIYTTAGSACPTGFTNNVTTAGVGDCTRLYAPNTGDAWAGVITRAPAARTVTKTAAIYAFDTITLTPKLLVNLGARYDDYSTSGLNVTATSANGLITGVTYTGVAKASWDFFNYQVGLVYKPTTSSSVYASYSTSSTPPGIAGGDQSTSGSVGTGNLATTQLEPEDTDQLRDRRQVEPVSTTPWPCRRGVPHRPQERPDPDSLGIYEQVGETQVQGVELGASGNLTPKWQVFGGYTYMDSNWFAEPIPASTRATPWPTRPSTPPACSRPIA
jgi:catecholate siderophore receptor